MHPVTRDKLKFNEDMKQYVPAEQLWSLDWNGDMDFEYDHSVYWPALNEMCQKRREERMARWTAAGCHIGESEDYLVGRTNASVSGFNFDATADPTPVAEAETIKGSDNGDDVDLVQEKLADTKIDGGKVEAPAAAA